MRSYAELFRSPLWCRLAAVAALAASSAACSSDVNRFGASSNYSNPYANSAQARPGADGFAQSSPRIDSQPLPPQGGYQQTAYSQPAASGSRAQTTTTGSISRAAPAATQVASSKPQSVAPAAKATASAATQVASATNAKAKSEAAVSTEVDAAPQPQRMAALEPAKNAAMLTTPAKDAAKDAAAAVKDAEAEDAASGFRWPVRGRVISGFGPKPTGQQNDGINLAVPEGTPIKAADDGVVAYAGNELKGYGNLVLVRHSNGYVTAYAHASEILVKRGDSVRRGQVIAKSGQTGDVTSPQVHFEVRKGSTPVDPMQHLVGAT